MLFNVDELLLAGGLGGRFNIPLGISLDDPFELVELLEDDGDVVVLLELLPLLLILLKVDKLCLTVTDGELFALMLFAFDSILKR